MMLKSEKKTKFMGDLDKLETVFFTMRREIIKKGK